jgi:phenylalanine-4-hydroxylase
VGDPEQPKLYGAGLLSSIGEASHCLTAAVGRIPLSLACVDQDFDITRMQPQLFVARDFDHLFEVLERFEATLAWKLGGDYGLEEARRAGTVNHLLLAEGLEITGQVARLVQGERRPDGNSIALAQLEGPVMVSRAGVTVMAEPWPGPALVAFGPPLALPAGPFRLLLPGGLSLSGVRVGEHLAEAIRGSVLDQPLALPDSALLFLSAGLPGVAGGPADPEAWDRWFGAKEPFSGGEAETMARRHKAEALPARLGELYLEVARIRDSGRIDPARLGRIREELVRYPEDWLLGWEIGELLGRSGT